MNRREWARATGAGITGLALPRGVHAQTATARHEYRYVHLDVFTDRLLTGNQLLVFVQPAGLDADAMQAFTQESNYSECTFVWPAEQAGTDHRVRIFGRTAEMPFAGHPTIGTAFALAHTGVLKPGMSKTVFGLGVGPTNIDLEWNGSQLAFAWMTQLKPTFGKAVEDSAALAAAIGVDASAIVRPAQEVNTGSTFLIVPLATRKAVDAAVVDGAKVDAVLTAAALQLQPRGLYVFSTERAADEATAYSRLLRAGVIEDPATGSAAGPAGSYAVKHGLVPPDRAASMTFLQGVLVGRPSHLHVRVSGSPNDITDVKVGGTSVVVGEGTMSA